MKKNITFGPGLFFGEKVAMYAHIPRYVILKSNQRFCQSLTYIFVKIGSSENSYTSGDVGKHNPKSVCAWMRRG